MALLYDLRLTVRHLAKAPGYAVAAILTLGLAIGASSAIFSAVYAVLLRPLPITAPSGLAMFWGAHAEGDQAVLELSYRTFEEWARATQSLSHTAAMGSTTWTMVQDREGEPVRLAFSGVSASFFDTLGVRPLLGRTFRPDDDVPNAPGVIVLNHGTWVRRFGADPNIVGTAVRLDEKDYTIVGVMPRGFDFPRGAELWAPVVPVLAGSDEVWNTNALANVGVLFVIGRLYDGVTPAAAAQELARLETSNRFGNAVVGTSFLDYVLGPVRPALWLLFAAVAVLLLIACANVSALMLTRVSMRRREHAVRLALGGTRSTLGRLWVLEAVVLAVVGGTLGLIASQWMAAAIVALAPDDVPRLDEVAINVPVAAFAFGVILITTLLCGIAPVRHAGAASLLDSLNDAARGSTGRQSRRTRSLLLVFQMGLAVVLLVSAGLVLRSFVNLRQLDLGFDTTNVLTMNIEPRASQATSNAWYDELLRQVSAAPGVDAAGAVYLRPLALGSIGQGTWALRDGQPDTPDSRRQSPTLNYQAATPGYFEAMRIRLLRGRLFDGRDRADTERVALVDESTARLYWPGEDPIGRRIGMPSFVPGQRGTVWRTVVGVVADVRYRGIDDVWLDVYDAAAQAAQPVSHIVVRGERDPLALAGFVQARARELDPSVVIDGITTMDAVVSRAIAPWRLSAWMFALFAGLAFVLAMVGLFSLASLDVVGRQREFAVRLALGAMRGDILRTVFTTAAAQAGLGIALGLLAAGAGTRALRALLFGVPLLDLATYAGVIALVAIVVAMAAYIPARRAAGIDPVALLKRE